VKVILDFTMRYLAKGLNNLYFNIFEQIFKLKMNLLVGIYFLLESFFVVFFSLKTLPGSPISHWPFFQLI
jgi:hypothetical protein